MFYDAESWILFEDYKEALPLYQQLLKVDPTNSSYKYRIGQCYINTPGEKEKAVSYLEDAVLDISPDYREGRFSETHAPYDALYYLANAYRINNQIDKALSTYKRFRENMDTEVYDSSIVNLQIQSCLNAKDLMSNPLYIKESKLSNVINESNSEFNPVVSDNEDMLVFSRSQAFYDAIMYSRRENGNWTGPVNLNEMLKVDEGLFPTSMSSDGKTLYLYSSADYDGIIYSSHLVNGTWSPITRLNDHINTKYWESHATLSHDNKKLYFTSNRKGGYGGLDIYVSKRDSTGDWGPAENLGPVINTPYNEESPFLSQDDKTLFFASRGHFNMGGYDIFYSTILPDGKMSVPLNAGYPLNTTDDDVFFKPLKDGYEGYFAKESPGGYGRQDIYKIEIFSDNHPRKFLIRGMVKVADLMTNFNDSVRISAMNIKKPGQVLVAYADPVTGEYEFELTHGNYRLTYEGQQTEKMTRDLDLSLTSPRDSFILPGTVLPRTDFLADLAVRGNTSVVVEGDDSIMFPLRVEPKSILTVEHWVGDSLWSKNDYIIRDTVFNYKTLPGPGNNRIVFRLTDRFSNITSAEVFITREKEQLLVRPEYSHIIARKQVEAFIGMLKSRSEGDLRKVIDRPDYKNQKFGRIDDVLDYIKEEALKENISAEEINKLALEVAALDNVLTQAAVDYLEKYSADEQLSSILGRIDIYKAGLTTWTDLQEYIATASENKLSPDDLNETATALLSDSDPSVGILKAKILAYARNSKSGTVIRESIATVDLANHKQKSEWLKAFYKESTRQGLSKEQFARILSVISELPDSNVEKLLSDLKKYAEEPFISYIDSLQSARKKIKKPEELFSQLLSAIEQSKLPEDLVFRSVSEVVTNINVPDDRIAERVKNLEKKSRSVIWFPGAAIIIIIVLIGSRKKRKKDETSG
jgi:hypothetical protein